MKKFLVVYNMPAAAMAEMMKNITPEEHKKGMDDWKKWMESHKENFVDMGSPVGKNTRVTKEGASETSNDIGGYSIIQGASKDEVTAMLADSPHITMPDAYVEVMEIVGMQ